MHQMTELVAGETVPRGEHDVTNLPVAASNWRVENEVRWRDGINQTDRFAL